MCILFNIYHGYHDAAWAQANIGDRNFDMHYIELYIFALDLYLNSLNQVPCKKTQSNSMWPTAIITICKYLTWWCVNRSILCPSGPTVKANLRSTSVQVMNTSHLGYSITRLESQNRKFAPISIITGPKNDHFFVCKQTGFVNQRLWDFANMTLTRVSSHWLWLESSHSVKNVTRVESGHHLSQCDSSRVRVTKNRDSSRVESLTRVTLSLMSFISSNLVKSVGIPKLFYFTQRKWLFCHQAVSICH